jgi:hypothetical protein
MCVYLCILILEINGLCPNNVFQHIFINQVCHGGTCFFSNVDISHWKIYKWQFFTNVSYKKITFLIINLVCNIKAWYVEWNGDVSLKKLHLNFYKIDYIIHVTIERQTHLLVVPIGMSFLKFLTHLILGQHKIQLRKTFHFKIYIKRLLKSCKFWKFKKKI